MRPAYHPDDDTLESYAMGRLGGAELEWLEEHLLVCEFCRRRCEQTEIFVRAMREAAQDVFEPIIYVHQTEVGPVRLEIARQADGWRARLRGAEIEAERWFADPGEAMRYLQRVFGELYPGHRCTAFCGR